MRSPGLRPSRHCAKRSLTCSRARLAPCPVSSAEFIFAFIVCSKRDWYGSDDIKSAKKIHARLPEGHDEERAGFLARSKQISRSRSCQAHLGSERAARCDDSCDGVAGGNPRQRNRQSYSAHLALCEGAGGKAAHPS